MTRGDQLAIAASGFLGVPFRLNGRDPAIGLDCVGLAVASLRAIGVVTKSPEGYALRNSAIDRWLSCATQSGLSEVNAPVAGGDILLVSAGPQQYHVLVADSPSSAVHAHAGLGRVVRQFLAQDHRVEAQWRLLD